MTKYLEPLVLEQMIDIEKVQTNLKKDIEQIKIIKRTAEDYFCFYSLYTILGDDSAAYDNLQSYIFLVEAEPMNYYTESETVLVNAFRQLIDNALGRIERNPEMYGVTSSIFSVEALKDSFFDPRNKGIFVDDTPSLNAMLEIVETKPLQFTFFWKSEKDSKQFEAVFDIFKDRKSLRIRLMWLNLPEKIPISPRVGIIEGRKPIPEAISTILRLFPGGRLESYLPP